jgi:hypothetical protein
MTEKELFVSVGKLSEWSPPRWFLCASCYKNFKPDTVTEEGGRKVGYWFTLVWNDDHSDGPGPSSICWDCAKLFASGDYRGASEDYEVDINELAATVRRVARKRRQGTFVHYGSFGKRFAKQIAAYSLKQAQRLEEHAHVVSPETFRRECRM